ncbi:MAG: polyamine aminopropyltransferase [Thermaerobacterales bacterium]
MKVWFSEDQTPDMRLSLRVTAVLHHEQSPYQEILVVDTPQFGRALILDNALQTSVVEEFVYHEMIAHVPLFGHPCPRKVLVIGGGDGGALREVLKHSTVEEARLVEIDERVVAVAQKFLPETSSCMADPRARVMITDGIRHVAESEAEYDVIIVDSTDPIGPAVPLFGDEFHRSAARALRPGGIFVQQSESPFFHQDLIRRVQRSLRGAFPWAGLYAANVPLYPGGLWTFSIAAAEPVPARAPTERVRERGYQNFHTRYYSPAVHEAAFVLPPFVTALTEEGTA